MRKNVLALSIATMIGGLGLVGAASAGVIPGTGANPTNAVLGSTNATSLQVAPGGIGHILVVPYFNAQNGNATVLSLVNTDQSNGKAVKIRFRGASNSDDILDFTILMSPGDVWQGLVDAPNNTSTARLTTQDRTCTIPSLTPGNPVNFITSRLDPSAVTGVADNTREGYIEIFNMADIPSKEVYGVATNSALYTAIKHVNGVPPCSSAALDNLLNDVTAEAAAAGLGLATPTTGLMGNWTIINVPQTTTFTGSATAIRALTNTGVDGRGNYVLFPQVQSNAPSPDNGTADPLMRTVAVGNVKTSDAGTLTGAPAQPLIAAQFYDLPDLSTPYIADSGLNAAIAGAAYNNNSGPRAQASILTTALAVTSIINEYATDASVQGKTDWVFSMPTRRYSVALSYSGTAPTAYYTNVPVTGGSAQFFYTGQSTVVNRQICVSAATQNGIAAQKFFDREETVQSNGAVFSPQQTTSLNFCGETSVLSFAPIGTASVLSSSVAHQNTTPPYVNGWANFGTVVAAGSSLGLPVLGSSFIKLTNPAATAGVSGTYGIVFDHRYTR